MRTGDAPKDSKSFEMQESLLQFIQQASRIVKEVRSERALPQILEQYLFNKNPFIFNNGKRLQAQMGFIVRINRDFKDYTYPIFLPEDLSDDNPFKKALVAFFKRRSPERKYIPIVDGKLYKHMLYERDAPLQSYLAADPFHSDNNIHPDLQDLTRALGDDIGRVLYSPLIGRWHRIYILMASFKRSDFEVDSTIHHAHDIIISRIGMSLLSHAIGVMKHNTITGDAAHLIHELWRNHIETHAEVINHSHRVAQIAITIAEDANLNVSDENINLIALSALAHDYGKTQCTHKMALISEQDANNILEIRKKQNKEVRKNILNKIVSRRKAWNELEEIYNMHPVKSAITIKKELSELGWKKPEDTWWILPILCHHKYNEEKGRGKMLSAKKLSVESMTDFLSSLDIENCKTVKDVLDAVRSRGNPLWQHAIDIVSIADDIDGDVSPTTYRPTSKIGPGGKITRIKQNKGKFPYYNENVIEALEQAEDSIMSIYSAPANLASM